MTKKNIVVIGGGSGISPVLKGLKNYEDVNLKAVITTADDGGSNKRVREEFGLLPSSDFRQALVSLADDKQVNESMKQLMIYRFSKGLGIEGMTFGNLMIIALTDIFGSQMRAYDEVGKILKIKGELIPITIENIRLMAKYENGDIIPGEHYIDEPEEHHDMTQKITKLYVNRQVKVFPKAREAIESADYIILGPGDLYTSILSNIVIGDAAELIKNSKAKLIYNINLMTKYGQTFNFSANDHVKEIERYIGRKIDYILLNNSELPQDELDKYKKENDFPVKDDLIDQEGQKVYRADLVAETVYKKAKSDVLKRSFIRHDSEKLALNLRKIIEEDL